MLPTSLLAHMTVTRAMDSGSRGSSASQHFEVQHAVLVNRQPANLGTFVAFEPLNGVQHGMVLDGGAQDRVAGAGLPPAGPNTGP